jgi:hypothetical protein
VAHILTLTIVKDYLGLAFWTLGAIFYGRHAIFLLLVLYLLFDDFDDLN